ncbi:unnamed protein product [Camellia sinensis]
MKLATLIIMKSAPLILVMKMLMRLKKFDDDHDKKGHTDDNDSVDDDAATLSSETEWSGDVDVADGHIFDEKRARMSLAKLFCTQAWPPQRVETSLWILVYRRMWHPNEMATDAAIGKSLSEWGIESKVFTITMGNNHKGSHSRKE